MKMKDLALKYFKEWYSCSESIVLAAADKGLCSAELLCVATPFSGGMSSGCLCGAIAGAQIVIGACVERDKARFMAKEFITKFKERNKATCCRILTREHENNSSERRESCKKYVYDCAEILEELVQGKVYA